MRIVSHRKLVEFYQRDGHSDSQAALERWYHIAQHAETDILWFICQYKHYFDYHTEDSDEDSR